MTRVAVALARAPCFPRRQPASLDPLPAVAVRTSSPRAFPTFGRGVGFAPASDPGRQRSGASAPSGKAETFDGDWGTRVSERWQSTRPQSGSALVAVMEPADLGSGDNPAP